MNATMPALNPHIRNTANEKISRRNRSNRDHSVSQSPSTRSAPNKAKTRHPGGRFKVKLNESASRCQPVAERSAVRNHGWFSDNVVRPMASRFRLRCRISTPTESAFCGFVVISCPLPSMRTAPRSCPSATSHSPDLLHFAGDLIGES